ncbi:HBL/NHE enterotoxin family protein [Bacillus mycoides]|uniref:HBL/NHE enterotoxin family protein n=1 Tax=Bacillus mycoides TaxID=1405 RepID=UPI002111435B|nr:HBL/NHE enterotoxin family protein [Bacillus mycoides]MCQ6530994.1 HBL/NHE enterotoxin family protein [Bacillus mycoides]
MRKNPYTVLAMASLLAMTTVNLAPPIQAFAQEQAISVNHKQGQMNLNKEDKENFQTNLTDMVSYYVTMQVYTQKILAETDINLEQVDLNYKDSSLKKDLPAHQQVARENATFWNGNLKKQMLKVNQGIISYDMQFKEYSKSLKTAIDAKDKETIKKLIAERLMKNVKKQQNDVNEVIENLNAFDLKLGHDIRAFDADGKKLIAILAGKDSLITVLGNQIDTYNATIDQSLKYLIGGAVGTGISVGIGGLAIGIAVLSGGTLVPVILGVGAISLLAGAGYTAYTNYDSMNTAKEGLKKVSQQLATANQALETLKGAQSSVDNLQKAVGEARGALGHISIQWGTTYMKYESLLDNIDTMSPDELELIKEDLEVAKKSWEDLRTWAEKIQNQLSGLNTIPIRKE